MTTARNTENARHDIGRVTDLLETLREHVDQVAAEAAHVVALTRTTGVTEEVASAARDAADAASDALLTATTAIHAFRAQSASYLDVAIALDGARAAER